MTEFQEKQVVTCFLRNRGDVLLLRRSQRVGSYQGKWGAVSGYVEGTPEETAWREIEEETGLRAEVVSTAPGIELEYPSQVAAPFTIMVEDIHDPVDGFHQHIDMIYFCRLKGASEPLNDGWRWVGREHLAGGLALDDGRSEPKPPPDDVRLLAGYAFDAVAG